MTPSDCGAPGRERGRRRGAEAELSRAMAFGRCRPCCPARGSPTAARRAGARRGAEAAPWRGPSAAAAGRPGRSRVDLAGRGESEGGGVTRVLNSAARRSVRHLWAPRGAVAVRAAAGRRLSRPMPLKPERDLRVRLPGARRAVVGGEGGGCGHVEFGGRGRERGRRRSVEADDSAARRGTAARPPPDRGR